MAKRIFVVIIIISLYTFTGCQGPNAGTSRLNPLRTTQSIGRSERIVYSEAGEIDIVEKIEAARQEYKQQLEILVRYYEKMGNNSKLVWANKELRALNVIPQYNYIVPVVAPAEYRATASIPDADLLYEDAMLFERQATPIMDLVTDEDAYRRALRKFEQLIEQYPTSDKIDDAAFEAGKISEHFKDYEIALVYYQRAYTWDPDALHPARFRAAYILDKFMHSYAEALELYRQAIQIEAKYNRHLELRRNAEERIKELEKIVE